jgi:CBS domain-containing protein
MRTYSIPLGSFFGVQLRLHFTFLLLGAFVIVQAANAGASVQRGCTLALLMLGAVILHEIGHAIAATFTHARLRLILLMPLGGVSFYAARKSTAGSGYDKEESKRFLSARKETLIALAGPFTSLLVAAISIGVFSVAFPQLKMDLWSWPFITGKSLPKSFVWINLLLGVINILPAYPLDFGRILRVQLSRGRSNIDAARACVGISQGIAIVLTIFGLFQQQNIWILLVGLFIFVGAQIEDRSLAFHSITESVRIGEVMLTDFSTLSPADTLEDALYKSIHTLQDDFPVIRSGDLVGIITRQRIVDALNTNGNGYVQSAMSKVLEFANRNETLGAVFRKLQARGITLIPVVEEERLVGIVTLQNLMHSLGLLAEQRRRASSPATPE